MNMENFQEAHQPNNHQNPSDISSQRKLSFIQDDQDFFCFLKSEENPTGPRPFFSNNGLSQDIIQVTEAEPDVALEVFYALYHTLRPQIEKQSSVSLQDVWTNFVGGTFSKGVLWYPEKLMDGPQDVKANFMKGEDVFLHLNQVVISILNLKMKLAGYPGEILHREEIMASLELAERFYTGFRSKVNNLLTMISQEQDPLTNYHALETILEHKAVMIGDIFGHHWAYRIPRKKAQKLLSLNKWKDHVENYSNEGASHSVSALPEKDEASEPLVYFKANGGMAIRPEKEFMLYSLYRQLQIPAPETALLILTNAFEEDPEYYFAVQASEAVIGESALEACQKKETIFDQEAYVQQVIGALLTNPSDGSFKNFKYNPMYKTLISIDNDLVFEPEFAQDSDKSVKIKSILYLIPQMDLAIPKATKTFFATLDPDLTIFSWLKDLSKKNKEYSLLFTRLTFQKTRCIYQKLLHQKESIPLTTCLETKVLVDPDLHDLHSGSFSPKILISKGLVARLREKLQIILNQPANTQILFENVSPILGKYYKKLRLEFNDPEKALEVLWNSSLLSPEEISSLSPKKNMLEGKFDPDKFIIEYKYKFASEGIPPLDKFTQCHIKRKREGLLNLSQALKELRLLIQEGLTDSQSPRDTVDLWHKISKMTEAEAEENLIKEITFLLSNKLPDQEFQWLFTLEKYFKRADYDVPGPSSAVITDTSLIKRLLAVTESEKLYLFDNQGNIRKNAFLTGRSNVTCFPEENPEFYLKQYPELPGYEFASILFMHMLGVNHLPSQELVIINSNPQYPVLLTQKVSGDPVYQIWQNPEAFNKLDPVHTGLLIISAMLINPEDGKEDNFILSPDGRYLIPIDNDHHFLPSTFQKRSTWSPWIVNTALQTKTLLFCLDEMNHPIPNEVKKQILEINFDLLLISWMRELVKVDDRYHHFVDEKQREAFLKNGTALRISFYPQFIHHLYWKVNKIQDLLRSTTDQTPLSLLKAVEPFAARCYQDSFQHGNTLQSRFMAATSQLYADAKTNAGGSRMSIINTQSILKMINLSEKDLQNDATYDKMWPTETLEVLEQLVEEREQKRKLEQDLLCQLDDKNEEGIWTTLFGNPLLESNLKNFFANPTEGLVLKGSKLITSSWLVYYFTQTPEQGAKIKFLSLPNSPLLDNKTLRALIEGCPNLEYLNVSGCVKLEEIVTAKEEWSLLTRLEARDCLNLKKLASHSPIKILRIGTHQQVEILIEKCILEIFTISTKTNQLDFLLTKRDNSFEIKPPENNESVARLLQNALLRDDHFDRYFKNPKITIGTHLISSPKDLAVYITSIDLVNFFTNQEKIEKIVQSNLIKLKSLQLPELNNEGGTNISKDLIQGNWPDLTHLNLSENEISDEGLAILSKGKWPQLEILNLSSKELTKKGLLKFALSANWFSLKEIRLSGISVPITDYPNNLLSKNWDSLVELDINSSGITKSEITSIVNRSRWPNLKHLNLSSNKITDEGLTILSNGNWPLLETLNLERASLTSAGMKTVVNTDKWQNLKLLNLSSNEITDAGFVILSHRNWPQLENLNITHTKVTNKGLLNFYLNVNWPKLKEINFPSYIDLNLAFSLHQKKLAQVERLELQNQEVTSGEIANITSQYHFEQLKYLNLSDNEIFDKKLFALADGEWPLLEELHLKNTKITSEGVKTLVNKMKLDNLKKLDISDNTILDIGLKTLTEGKWPLFQHLVYYDTKVTLKGNLALLQNLQWPNLLHLEHSLTESFYNYSENWSLPEIILVTAPMYYNSEAILVTVLDITWLNSKEIYLSIRHHDLNETIMILPRDKRAQLKHLKLSLSSLIIQPRLWPSSLKTLDLSNTTSGKLLESIVFFENLPLVEHLDLRKTDLTTKGIEIFINQIGWPSLKKLCISHNQICDEGLELLLSRKWPLLESLNLSNISLSAEGISSLFSISDLKALNISDNLIRDSGLKLLASAKFPQLESLNISKISITAEGIKSLVTISEWPNLKILDVSDNSISDRGLKFLSGVWTFLENLTLRNIGLTAEGIRNMIKHSEWSRMKKLDISNNPIGDKGLEILSSGKWPALESLNLSNISVTGGGIKSLAGISKWPYLKILDISDNQIYDFGLKFLASGKWPELESINLRGVSVTAEGIKDLVSISKWPSLKSLDASHNPIYDQGLEFLISADWLLLENLSLKSALLTESGIEIMVKRSNWLNLRIFDISDNSINDKGLQLLSSGDWPELENLNLAKTSLTIKGIGNLVRFSDWPNLKEMHLQDPQISLESVEVRKLISAKWPNVQLIHGPDN